MGTIRIVRAAAIALVAVSLSTYLSAGVTVTPEELQQNDQWVQQNLLGSTQPFSFTYNGQSSSTLLSSWTRTMTTTQLDAQRTQREITWTDPATKLEVSCKSVEYANYPVVEWTTSFRNTGTSNTPLLQNVQGLNTTWNRDADGEFILRGIQGDGGSIDNYRPYIQTLGPNTSKSFAPDGGRPTNGQFPYYNLSMSGGGVMMTVGWPGEWATNFTRDSTTGLQVTAGQQTSNVYLKPGEEFRAPLVALCNYQGTDTVRAQNIWRKWMLDYSLPGATGEHIAPLTSMSVTYTYPGYKSTAVGEISTAGKFVNADATPDYWWNDAGWYPCGDGWWNTGTWTPDPVRYPNGLKEVSDYVHANGMKYMTWFEPERVTAGSWLAVNHPDWVIGGSGGGLLNLGNPAAREWLTNQVNGLIASQGIDLYRQDFNMDPLGYWNSADASNRQGMTENQHIQGYLAYWDAIRAAHPEITIDSCASGGRRNDLETLRRGVPLWQTDYMESVTAYQCMTYGLVSWIPYHGLAAVVGSDWGRMDNYHVRSICSPAIAIIPNPSQLDNGTVNWTQYRRMLDEQRQLAPYMLGDFYPLSLYSQAEDAWMVWQFDRSDLGEGMVEAFRRSLSNVARMLFRPAGLDPTAVYELTNLDTHETSTGLGTNLMAIGLWCQLDAAPSSAVFTYRVIPKPSSYWTGIDAVTTWSTVAGLNNWRNNGGTAADYRDGADVTFDDTANGLTADISAAYVYPASVTFNNLERNFVVTGIKGIAGTTGVLKRGAGTVILNSVNLYTGTTTVQAGILQLGESAQSPVLTGGGADIQGGKMVFVYTTTTPAPTISALLKTSYDTLPHWTTGKFHSTTATSAVGLGWVENTTGSKNVTVMATYYGDTNLDGSVTSDDLFKLLSKYSQAGNWSQGDTNYDGNVTSADLFKLLSNYNQTLPVSQFTPTVVPEPQTGVLATIGLGILATYAGWGRRRRSAVGA